MDPTANFSRRLTPFGLSLDGRLAWGPAGLEDAVVLVYCCWSYRYFYLSATLQYGAISSRHFHRLSLYSNGKSFRKTVVAYLLSIKCPLVHLTLSTNADLVAHDPVWHAMSLHWSCDANSGLFMLLHFPLLNLNFLVDHCLSRLKLIRLVKVLSKRILPTSKIDNVNVLLRIALHQALVVVTDDLVSIWASNRAVNIGITSV